MPLAPGLLALSEELASSLSKTFVSAVEGLEETSWGEGGMGYGEKEMMRAAKKLAKVSAGLVLESSEDFWRVSSGRQRKGWRRGLDQ